MGEGWIKLYRKLLDKAIWECSTPEQKVILITLLLMANHDEKEWEWNGKKFKCKPGQFVTSLNSIVKKAGKGISIKNVRTALEKFKNYEFLTYESAKTGRLITILNYNVYQCKENKTGKDTGKQVAKDRQRTGKQVATNKNDKNVRSNNYMSDSNEYRLASYLFKFIKRNNPKTKEPNLQKWSKTFDYILRIDKRDIEDVKNVIKFCQDDSFWLKNILSPDKLRKQYDRLLLEMRKPKKVENNYSKKESTFNNFKQRKYDFKDLERKLLGWEEDV